MYIVLKRQQGKEKASVTKENHDNHHLAHMIKSNVVSHTDKIG